MLSGRALGISRSAVHPTEEFAFIEDAARKSIDICNLNLLHTYTLQVRWTLITLHEFIFIREAQRKAKTFKGFFFVFNQLYLPCYT